MKKVEDKITIIEKRKVNYAKLLAEGIMDVDTYRGATLEDDKEFLELQEQKELLNSCSNQNQIDLISLHRDFKQFLYSEEVPPELIHRSIKRTEIENDGTTKVFYNFRQPSIKLKIS